MTGGPVAVASQDCHPSSQPKKPAAIQTASAQQDLRIACNRTEQSEKTEMAKGQTIPEENTAETGADSDAVVMKIDSQRGNENGDILHGSSQLPVDSPFKLPYLPPPDENSKSSDGSPQLPPAPDGGWGWMVVLGSLFIHIIADGITYTFGIFFVELVSYFATTKAAIGGIVSVLVSLTLGSGPVSSGLVETFGCRAVTIAGSIVAAVGFVISVWAPNIICMYLAIGVLGGIGLGLMYLPAIVMVSCYFEKKRAFATGIAVCGSGFGTFLFAPILERLIKAYGWKTAMLVVGIVLGGCSFCGMLFRPLKLEEEEDEDDTEECTKEFHPLGCEEIPMNSLTSLPDDCAEKEPFLNSCKQIPVIVVDTLHFNNNVQENGNIPQKSFSSVNLPVLPTLQMRRDTSSQSLVMHSQVQNAQMSPSKYLRERSKSQVAALLAEMAAMAPEQRKRTASTNSGPMCRQDAFYSGSLQNIPGYKSCSTVNISNRRMSHKDKLSSLAVAGTDTSSSTDNSGMDERMCPILRDTVGRMLDMSLLKDPVYVLIAVSNFCTSIGFNAPFLYIKDRALLFGMTSDDGSSLIAIVGIANTLSRIVLGYISDKPNVNRLYLYNFALIICGLSTAFSSFTTSYVGQAIYASVFGITAGAYVGLTSVLLVDLFGIQKLTNSFGVLLLFQGVATLIGPPLVGFLYDELHSYDPGFFLAGGMLAASGAMLFFVPLLKRHQERKNVNVITADQEEKQYCAAAGVSL